MDPTDKSTSLKRRRIEEYPYPPIPKTDQDGDHVCGMDYNDPFTQRRVPVISSTEWGTEKIAEFQAINTTHIDDKNEGLVRSHHPALRSIKNVFVSESIFGPPVWVVDSPVHEVEAAGRPIHYFPGDYSEYIYRGVLTPRDPYFFNRHFARYINPRRFLTASDLDSLRELFPQAVGVEVLIAGFIIVLFDRISEVENAYNEVWPLELAGLRVIFHMAHYECTTAPIESGLGLSPSPLDECDIRAGCLGLKLRLPDGSMAITTVTHGFVKFPKASKGLRIISGLRGFYNRVKTSLMHFLPARMDEQDAPHVISQGDLSNSPIGKQVWLESTNRKIGTITKTYDEPSDRKPYPLGYLHDLSLISDPNLPNVTNPPGYPLVAEWAEYSAALEQQEVYVVCHHAEVGRWRCIEGIADGTLFKKATVLGTGYTWDRLQKSQGAFLLWHTGDDVSPANGWSGAPLCLGRRSDATAKAIVFQNFQRWCILSDQFHPRLRGEALIKAGFVLPAEIRSSRILTEENQFVRREHNTMPAGGRSTGEAYRRIVSGI